MSGMDAAPERYLWRYWLNSWPCEGPGCGSYEVPGTAGWPSGGPGMACWLCEGPAVTAVVVPTSLVFGWGGLTWLVEGSVAGSPSLAWDTCGTRGLSLGFFILVPFFGTFGSCSVGFDARSLSEMETNFFPLRRVSVRCGFELAFGMDNSEFESQFMAPSLFDNSLILLSSKLVGDLLSTSRTVLESILDMDETSTESCVKNEMTFLSFMVGRSFCPEDALT